MKIRITSILVILVAVIGIVLYYTFRSPYLVSGEEGKQLIQQGKVDVVLDVRSKLEYNLGHYPEAVHIPTQQLNERIEQEIPRKETGILIYCNTGQRSRYATDLLRAKGYKNVKYIAGPYWTLLR
jgi:rhodanese-related sulfurtransferase